MNLHKITSSYRQQNMTLKNVNKIWLLLAVKYSFLQCCYEMCPGGSCVVLQSSSEGKAH